MAEDTFNLFYPWFYQGEMQTEMYNYKDELIASGIDRLESNKSELIRLYRDFSELDLTDKAFLLHIGANCNDYKYEEASTSPEKVSSLNNCKLRLIPPFFIESLINIGKPGIIFIVDNFGDNSDISKLSTRDINIIKTDTENKYNINKYYADDVDITIYLYNTYFPTYLDENLYYTVNGEITRFIIERRRESDDKRFVIEFYRKLKFFLLKPIFSVILSTASFRLNRVTSKRVLNAERTGGKVIEGNGNLDLELYPEINENMENPKVLFILWPYGTEYFLVLRYLVKFDYKEAAITFQNIDEEIKLIGREGYVTKYQLGKDVYFSNIIRFNMEKQKLLLE